MGPNRELAIKRYRKHANGYDATTHRMEPVRKQVIQALRAHCGDTVGDIACSRGKSFAIIWEAIWIWAISSPLADSLRSMGHELCRKRHLSRP